MTNCWTLLWTTPEERVSIYALITCFHIIYISHSHDIFYSLLHYEDAQRDNAVDLCLGALSTSPSIFYKDVESEEGTIKKVPFRHQFYKLPPNVFASNARFNPKTTEEINEDLNDKLVFIHDVTSREYMNMVKDLAGKIPDEKSTDFSGLNDEEKKQAYLPAVKLLLKSIIQVNVGYFMSVEFEVEGDERKGLDANASLTRTPSLDKILDASLKL